MHVGFLRVLQPVDVLGVLGPVDGTEGLELYERDVLQAGEFGQDAPGGVVQFFIVQDQAAGELHVVEGLAVLDARAPD